MACSMFAFAPVAVIAKGTTATDTTIFLRPHCDREQSPDETMFGPIPDLDELVTLGHDDCPAFEVEDPLLLKTDYLKIGDTLDIDVVAYNHRKETVNSVRSWLSYDPNVLEGISIEMHTNFPFVTPGESDFDPSNGYVMLEGSNDDLHANEKALVVVARIQFRILKDPPPGTYILFHDVQPGGHTSITGTRGGSEQYMIAQDPGGLHVIFQSEPPPPSDIGGDTAGDDSGDTSGDSAGDIGGDGPLDAPDDVPPGSVDDGGACTRNEDCVSNLCVAGICIPNENPDSDDGTDQNTVDRTAFALLQVNNLRVTCEGSSAYLGWDELNSSALKAYNVYYGTTSGRYIQRKTIEGSMDTVTIRALPLGTTYFFALRAVSKQDEESAFSQEVSIEICDPSTSTSPLVASVATIDNPLPDDYEEEEIPGGPVGSPSILAILLLMCAAVGTILASRRQFHVTAVNPRS